MLALATIAALVTSASAAATTLPVLSCVTKDDCPNATYGPAPVCCTNGTYNGSAWLGRCSDSRFEQCCDRTVCNSLYETCCNATCCSAAEGCVRRSLLEYDEDQCSATEKFDFRRGLITIGFPLLFGIAAIASAVVALIVVLLAGFQPSGIAIAIIIISTIVVTFSILMIVSPLVFPMFFVSSVASLAILSLGATRPTQRPELVLSTAVLLVALAFIIMINPFSTNSMLGGGPSYGSVDIDHSPGGVVGVVLSYLSEYDQIVAKAGAGTSVTTYVSLGGNRDIFSTCSAFYLGYFQNDPALYADWRIHDQRLTAIPWGLCSRGYLTYQLFDAVLVTVLLPVLAILLIARWWQVRGKLVAEVGDQEMQVTASS